jgi:hypothetical protein
MFGMGIVIVGGSVFRSEKSSGGFCDLAVSRVSGRLGLPEVLPWSRGGHRRRNSPHSVKGLRRSGRFAAGERAVAILQRHEKSGFKWLFMQNLLWTQPL